MNTYTIHFIYADGIRTICSGLQVSAPNPIQALRSLFTGRTHISSDVIGVEVYELSI